MKTIEINLIGEFGSGSTKPLPNYLNALDPLLVRTMVIALALALVVPFVVTTFVNQVLIAGANSQSEALDAQLSSSHKNVDQILALQRRVKALDANVRDLTGLLSNGSAWAPTLDEIRSLTPTDLWLTGLSATGQTLVINGEALDYKAIAYFYANLQHAHHVVNPIMGDLSQDKSKNQVTFSVTCTLADAP